MWFIKYGSNYLQLQQTGLNEPCQCQVGFCAIVQGCQGKPFCKIRINADGCNTTADLYIAAGHLLGVGWDTHEQVLPQSSSLGLLKEWSGCATKTHSEDILVQELIPGTSGALLTEAGPSQQWCPCSTTQQAGAKHSSSLWVTWKQSLARVPMGVPVRMQRPRATGQLQAPQYNNSDHHHSFCAKSCTHQYLRNKCLCSVSLLLTQLQNRYQCYQH